MKFIPPNRHFFTALSILFIPFIVKALPPQNMFTPQEVQQHRERIDTITAASSECIKRIYQDHLDFYSRWGISKYYGDTHPDYQTKEGLINALKKYGAPESLVSELKPTSCIGFTMVCMKEGFQAAKMEDTWKKIYAHLSIGYKFYGTDLQDMLRQLGWKIYYWNPDPSQNKIWDQEDMILNPAPIGSNWMPQWGGHAYRYQSVMQNNKYYGVQVDDKVTLVNFKDIQPEVVRKTRFFVGSAHAGYHIFVGFEGQSYEAHASRELNVKENMETGPFNPLAFGSSPVWTATEKYRSGIIALPPEN